MPAAPAAPPPAAAPAGSPPPAAPASPAPPAPPTEKSLMAEDEAELDSLADDSQPKPERPPRGRAPAPKVSPPKPPEGQPAPKPEADKDKGGEPKPPGDDLDGPEPIKVPEVRDWGRRLRKQIKEQYKPEIEKLQARVKELEETGPADNGAHAQEIETLRKRNAELEQEISYVDYSKSADYQDKYAKPYVEAWNKAVRDFSQMVVKIPAGKDEDGAEKFQTRKATPDDLVALANMPIGEMDEAAERMFGKAAPRVIRHVERVRELAEAQNEALETARKTAGERTTQLEENKKANATKGKKMWQDEHTRILKKWPKFFGPRDGDAEGNSLLDKGKAEAEKVFAPTDANRPKTAEEAVALHARAYFKVMNHNRIALDLKKANARIAELEKALSDYEDRSEPGGGPGGEPGGSGGAGGIGTLEGDIAELDALAK